MSAPRPLTPSSQAAAPRNYGHFIAGRHVAGESGRSGPVFDPATGVEHGRVAYASAAETGVAVATAAAAQPRWRDTAPLQRARVMFRFKALIEKNADELAGLITREHGKVLSRCPRAS